MTVPLSFLYQEYDEKKALKQITTTLTENGFQYISIVEGGYFVRSFI